MDSSNGEDDAARGDDIAVVLERALTGEISPHQAHAALTSVAPQQLVSWLRNVAAIGSVPLPATSATLAKIILAVRTPTLLPRADGNRAAAPLRWAINTAEHARIYCLKHVVGGGIEIVEEAHIAIEPEAPALPPREVDELPPREVDEPPQQDIPASPIARSALGWSRVNIKVVFWIPHIPNDFPNPNRALVHEVNGRTEELWPNTMTFWEELAMKLLFATGNPPPPERFQDAAAYRAFRDTKEYRGILDLDLLICFEGRRIRHYIAPEPTYTVGFTPALSAAAPDQLHTDHLVRESLASQVERALQSDPLSPLAGIPWYAPEPDYLEDVYDAIVDAARRNPHPTTRHSFTQGLGIHAPYDVRVPAERRACLIGEARMGIQVNPVENLLYYAMVGRLLPYMNGRLLFRFCHEGANRAQFHASLVGTSLPNKTLYVNNVAQDTFDLLTLSYDDLRVSVPLGADDDNDDADYLDDPAAIEPQWAAELRRTQASFTSDNVEADFGCPDDIPDSWPLGIDSL